MIHVYMCIIPNCIQFTGLFKPLVISPVLLPKSPDELESELLLIL